LIAKNPTWKKGRERQLRINDEINVSPIGFVEKGHEPFHDLFSALIFGDWSELGSTDHELTGHGLSSFVALFDGTTAIIAEPLQNVKGAAIIR
jgi:hypothetical protein